MKDPLFSATARKKRGLKKTILTDTRASVTLVSTAGRREWTRILCSVTANTSRVAAFLGPRFRSNVERLPPLPHKNTQQFKKTQKTKNPTSFQIRIAKNASCLNSEMFWYLYLSGSGEDTGWLSIRLSCGDSCGRHTKSFSELERI